MESHGRGIAHAHDHDERHGGIRTAKFLAESPYEERCLTAQVSGRAVGKFVLEVDVVDERLDTDFVKGAVHGFQRGLGEAAEHNGASDLLESVDEDRGQPSIEAG